MKKISIFCISLFLCTGCNEETIPQGTHKQTSFQQEIIDIEIKEDTISTQKSAEELFEELSFNITKENQNFKKYLPTFMFHYVKDIDSNGDDPEGYTLSVSPARLEEFLIFFQKNNIQTVTFWDLKEILEGKKEMPKKAVMLTFDDGYIDHYSNAYTMLKKYNAKGTFFIIANKPDKKKYYATWDQIKEMSDNDQEIASHTLSHPNLSSLSTEQIEEELLKSRNIIAEKIQKPVISLCYPAGDYDERVKKIAEKYYLFARTTEPGKNFSVRNRHEVPTTRMFPTTGVASLRIWFGG